jgi:hypothetical protein
LSSVFFFYQYFSNPFMNLMLILNIVQIQEIITTTHLQTDVKLTQGAHPDIASMLERAGVKPM